MSPDCPAIVAEEAGAPGLQAPQATCAAGARSDQLHPMLTAAAVRSRGRDGRDSPPPQGLGEGKWVALARALEPCRTQPPACLLSLPAHPRAQAWVSWRSLGRRPQSTSYPTLPLMTTTPLTVCWMGPLTVTHWQLVAYGRGLLPTNGWAGPLMVTHWQLAAVGGAWCQPTAEQDH